MAGYVQKRLLSSVSRLASVSPSAISRFPPREAFIAEASVPRPAFDPELWAALQPVPSSALSAFSHRIGIASVTPTEEELRQACTHPSFVEVFRHHYPTEKRIPKSNQQLEALGNSLMALFAMEYLQVKYPYLPTRVQKAALTAHIGHTTLASVAQEMGAAPLLKWHRKSETPTSRPVLFPDALASIPRSLTALIYKKHSLPSARKFVHSYFLTRNIDLRAMLKFLDPKKALREMIHRFDREAPKSRILKETGRFSNSPVYVVGMYSGADKLGEGFGSSLKMAEFRAAEDSLHRVFLTHRPEHEISLPSHTFSTALGDVFAPLKPGVDLKEGSYEPPELVIAEIRYGSAHKSKAAAIHKRL